jgi:lipopolysaccharide export system permease protein
MKVLQRYFVDEVTRSVLFVLLAFLALFSFYDLTGELKSIGRGGYQLHHAFSYVLLGVPGRVYELMPIAALIGTIWALAQFAARSEFTIMRVSGLSTAGAGWMLAKIGLAFVAVTFLFGEILSPIASDAAEKLKLSAQGASLSKEFRSGTWAKDVIKSNGVNGDPVGTRFMNVQEVRPDGKLHRLKLYEFDREFRMTSIITADHANYQGDHVWRLFDVTVMKFPLSVVAADAQSPDTSASIVATRQQSRDLVSDTTPEILSVVFADPDRMSAYSLLTYTRHLAENKQDTPRYEIAFWKKLIYPFAVLVMMALALPFAYMHVRAGGVSLKIFIGIMIGVSFELLNGLFSHLGLLNTWSPLATALLPSTVFLLFALGALWRVERR